MDKITEALKLALERSYAEPVQPVKQEPVAKIDRRAESLRYHATGFNQAEAQRRIANYKPPVSAKAIRAEAFEDAVKFLEENGMIAPNGFTAAGIRGLK